MDDGDRSDPPEKSNDGILKSAAHAFMIAWLYFFGVLFIAILVLLGLCRLVYAMP